MVIGDLNVISIAATKNETDAVLVVDSYAVLPFAIADEFLQVVTRRHSQVVNFMGSIKHGQLSTRDARGR